MLDLLGLILVGLVIGALARLAIPGRQPIGLLRTLLLGMAGAVIGGTAASLVDRGEVFDLDLFGFVVAVIAAVALLIAGQRAGILEGGERDRLAGGRRY